MRHDVHDASSTPIEKQRIPFRHPNTLKQVTREILVLSAIRKSYSDRGDGRRNSSVAEGACQLQTHYDFLKINIRYLPPTHGTLRQWFVRSCHASQTQKKNWYLQLVNGLIHMHDVLGIAHCDIRPENILIYESVQNGGLELKFTEVSTAIILSEITPHNATTWFVSLRQLLKARTKASKYNRLPYYIAPELLDMKGGDTQKYRLAVHDSSSFVSVDYWALGMVLRELFCKDTKGNNNISTSMLLPDKIVMQGRRKRANMVENAIDNLLRINADERCIFHSEEHPKVYRRAGEFACLIQVNGIRVCQASRMHTTTGRAEKAPPCVAPDDTRSTDVSALCDIPCQRSSGTNPPASSDEEWDLARGRMYHQFVKGSTRLTDDEKCVLHNTMDKMMHHCILHNIARIDVWEYAARCLFFFRAVVVPTWRGKHRPLWNAPNASRALAFDGQVTTTKPHTDMYGIACIFICASQLLPFQHSYTSNFQKQMKQHNAAWNITFKMAVLEILEHVGPYSYHLLSRLRIVQRESESTHNVKDDVNADSTTTAVESSCC